MTSVREECRKWVGRPDSIVKSIIYGWAVAANEEGTLDAAARKIGEESFGRIARVFRESGQGDDNDARKRLQWFLEEDEGSVSLLPHCGA